MCTVWGKMFFPIQYTFPILWLPLPNSSWLRATERRERGLPRDVPSPPLRCPLALTQPPLLQLQTQFLRWAWASRALHHLYLTNPLLPALGPHLVQPHFPLFPKTELIKSSVHRRHPEAFKTTDSRPYPRLGHPTKDGNTPGRH